MAALLASHGISAVEMLIVVKYLLDLVDKLLHAVILVAIKSLLDYVEVYGAFYYFVKVNHVRLVEIDSLSKDFCVFYS